MAENIENNGCSQRDNAEHEGYVLSLIHIYVGIFNVL